MMVEQAPGIQRPNHATQLASIIMLGTTMNMQIMGPANHARLRVQVTI